MLVDALEGRQIVAIEAAGEGIAVGQRDGDVRAHGVGEIDAALHAKRQAERLQMFQDFRERVGGGWPSGSFDEAAPGGEVAGLLGGEQLQQTQVTGVALNNSFEDGGRTAEIGGEMLRQLAFGGRGREFLQRDFASLHQRAQARAG